MNKPNVLKIQYNSDKDRLVLPEYGRNIHLMIEFAKTVPDYEKRSAYVHAIIELMYQMSPQNKNVDNFRDRLWNHLYEIAGYDIDITPPNGIIPVPEPDRKIPHNIPYPKSDSKLRHYGHNVKKLIAKALEMEDENKKEGLVNCIGSYMKLAFRTWNREHYVTDEVIKSDIVTLSDGQLSLEEDAVFENIKPGISNAARRNNPNNNRRRPGNNNNRNNSGGFNRNRSAGSGNQNNRNKWRNNRPNS